MKTLKVKWLSNSVCVLCISVRETREIRDRGSAVFTGTEVLSEGRTPFGENVGELLVEPAEYHDDDQVEHGAGYRRYQRGVVSIRWDETNELASGERRSATGSRSSYLSELFLNIEMFSRIL